MPLVPVPSSPLRPSLLRPSLLRRFGGPEPPTRRPKAGPLGPPPRRRIGRWLNRYRRLAVALLLCIAAGLAVQQLTPVPPDTVAAIAAARDLPAGKSLAPEDLSVVKFPTGLVPGGSFTAASELRGKQLAVALRAGQVLTDAQLLGPGMLAGSPPGAAAVPLRMADPSSVQLVSPGQLVNVVMASGNGFEQPAASLLLAAAVPVLWTSADPGQAGQWLGTAETAGLMVVAADAAQAQRLAGASTQGKLFFVLVGAAPG